MNWVWSKVGKAIGGLLVFSGGSVAAAFGVGILLGHATGGLLTLLAVLLVMFGLGPAALGSFVLYTSFRAERQAIRDRFYQVLQVSQGRLSLLDFAAATKLEPMIARQYLDGWAKECCANFEVTDAGDIYYCFTAPPIAMPTTDLSSAAKLKQAMRQWLRSV